MWVVGAGWLIVGSRWHMISHTCLTQHIKIKQGIGRNRAPWDAAYKCELCWKCNYLDRHKNHPQSDNHPHEPSRLERLHMIVSTVQQLHIRKWCSAETVNVKQPIHWFPWYLRSLYRWWKDLDQILYLTRQLHFQQVVQFVVYTLNDNIVNLLI